MNIAIVQGRPVRDPEMFTSNRTGKVFCKVRVACDRPYRGKDAPKKADYFEIVVFGKLAQTVYNNLAKGALCTVIGRLETTEWFDKVGNKHEGVNIIANGVTIHEWLRKHRPLEELDSDFDTELLVPREITNSLMKQIDITDEDIPDDLAGRPYDDSLQI